MMRVFASGGSGKQRNSSKSLAQRAIDEDWGEKRLSSELNNAYKNLGSRQRRTKELETRMTINRLAGRL